MNTRKLLPLLCLLSSAALAGNFGLGWTNATKDTTGANLPATGPDSLAGIKVEYITCTSVAAVVWPASPSTVTVLAVPPSMVVANLPTGSKICARAYSITVAGVLSDASNVAIGPVLGVKPQPPGNITFTVTDPVAYKIRLAVDDYTVLAIGTVPIGTPCDTAHNIDGFMPVPRAAVQLASRFDTLPLVVFAQCG